MARSSRTEAQRIVEDFWKSVELPSRAGDDYYAALDLAPDSCKRDIEKKIRDLSLEWHPDKVDRRCLKLVPEDAEGRSEVIALLRETFAPIHEKEFRILSEAKDVLTNDEKRAEYDAERNAPVDQFQAFFNAANFPANFSFPANGKSGSFSFTFSSSGAQTPRAQKKPEPKFRQKQGSRV
jgi:DnaJ-class molecular chaperone